MPTLIAKNLLDLDNPASCICILDKYQKYLKSLVIHLWSEELYVWFRGVMYFAGPSEWQGASLCIATREDTVKLAQERTIQWRNADSDNRIDIPIARSMRLYVFPSSSMDILVLGLKNYCISKEHPFADDAQHTFIDAPDYSDAL